LGKKFHFKSSLIVRNEESWYNQYDPGRFLLEERRVEMLKLIYDAQLKQNNYMERKIRHVI